MGYLLEKTWLSIFNYKKNNKNYIDLNVNDYLTYETNLIIKNNTIKFNIFNINCFIYMNIYIDYKKYNLYIDKNNISIVKQIRLKEDYLQNNILIQEVLKDMNNVEFKISLHKNIIQILGNNVLLFEYKFNYNVNQITYSMIFDL